MRSSRYRTIDKNLTEEDMTPWKTEVLRKVDDKIKILRRKLKFQKSDPVLKRPEVIDYLKQLHETFVFVPIDKAGNNIAVICKK